MLLDNTITSISTAHQVGDLGKDQREVIFSELQMMPRSLLTDFQPENASRRERVTARVVVIKSDFRRNDALA